MTHFKINIVWNISIFFSICVFGGFFVSSLRIQEDLKKKIKNSAVFILIGKCLIKTQKC